MPFLLVNSLCYCRSISLSFCWCAAMLRVFAESMIQLRYHCRPKREMHGTPLYSRMFIRNEPLDVLAKLARKILILFFHHGNRSYCFLSFAGLIVLNCAIYHFIRFSCFQKILEEYPTSTRRFEIVSEKTLSTSQKIACIRRLTTFNEIFAANYRGHRAYTLVLHTALHKFIFATKNVPCLHKSFSNQSLLTTHCLFS